MDTMSSEGARMNVDRLAPYDLFLQLMKNPDKKTNYTDALVEIEASHCPNGPDIQPDIHKDRYQQFSGCIS